RGCVGNDPIEFLAAAHHHSRPLAHRLAYRLVKPNFLLVYFMPEKAPGDALETMVAPDGEEAKLDGREIYVHYPNGS
ncbi:hypothetical protein ACC692_38840, partial [Rhizobium ruizarguesonis]